MERPTWGLRFMHPLMFGGLEWLFIFLPILKASAFILDGTYRDEALSASTRTSHLVS